MAKPRTADDFLRELRATDRTIADWCREHGFNQSLAYRVLKSPAAGRWGESRKIAKAMQLRLPDMPAAIRRREPVGA